MKICTVLSFLCLVFLAHSQQGDGGIPVSSKFAFEPEITRISFPQPDLVALAAEDLQMDGKGLGPWRFGSVNTCNLNTSNSGSWFGLPNGGKIWLLEVHCENALTVNLTLQNSRIPEGNLLYAYHPNRSFVLGQFTQRHLVEGALGMELVEGSRTIIEYYVAPENLNNIGQIEIGSVTHGYRTAADYNRALGDSGSCNMNVNCPDGQPYQNQRNAALMLVSGSSGFCSGSLINNTANDGKPYVLTARHCGSSGFQNWIFRFNWQATACTNPSSSPTFQSLSGSVNRAGSLNNTFDMRLVEITGGLQNGTVPETYNPFFAGWDNSGSIPPSTYCIHHPSGDIKKIAFDDNPAVISQDMGSTVANSVWQVVWDRNTTTEGGSSGSPLFDNMGRIIGQLWGGGASCQNLSSPDWYGRVSMSWNPAGSTNAQQLKFWLDPDNSGVSFINGYPNDNALALDASLAQGDNWTLTGTICGTNVTPSLKITNLGTTTLTSAAISYTYSPGGTQQFNWSGSLTPGQSTTVTLPNQTFVSGNYTFVATIVNVNGQSDENANNNTINNAPFTIVTNGYAVNMNLELDCYGSEITWRLLNQNQTQVLSTGGPYADILTSQITINQNWCLQEACYLLEVNDTYGDGLNGGGQCNFIGSLQITEGGSVLNEISSAQADFNYQKKLPFCLGEATNSLESFAVESLAVTLHPNPADDALTLDFNLIGKKSIQVFTSHGALLVTAEDSNNQWSYNTSSFAQGMYFVVVEVGGQKQTLKFVKR